LRCQALCLLAAARKPAPPQTLHQSQVVVLLQVVLLFLAWVQALLFQRLR